MPIKPACWATMEVGAFYGVEVECLMEPGHEGDHSGSVTILRDADLTNLMYPGVRERYEVTVSWPSS